MRVTTKSTRAIKVNVTFTSSVDRCGKDAVRYDDDRCNDPINFTRKWQVHTKEKREGVREECVLCVVFRER